jgi:hypothetical protein
LFEQRLQFETPLIDVEGSATVVRVGISRVGKHLFTDFTLRYQFDENRKIVSKIFHSHGSPLPDRRLATIGYGSEVTNGRRSL